MFVSYKWLHEFLRIDLTSEELKDKLTFSGIEVEDVKVTGELLHKIIIGEIIKIEKLPDSDKLSICEVYDGENIHRVVCGAPNVVINQKIAFARVGTDFGDFKLKKVKIRGVESNGMICSEKELGISDNHDGIMVIPSDEMTGTSLADYTGLSDTIFEVEITPNRPDLLGMIGIARDLSAQLNIPLLSPFNEQKSLVKDLPNSINNDFSVEIHEKELCTRYIAIRIGNVKITSSPKHIKEKLIKANIKPINNIVDITNYVMYIFGHPIHAFDQQCLEGKKILVRKSKPKEMFPALDHQMYELTGNELVIADTSKPIALAGVIGGKNSHITEETKDIVIEVACFNSSIIRRTSNSLKIFTDSSYRFERGMCEDTCETVAVNTAKLILDLAGGKIIQKIDIYQEKKKPLTLKLRPQRVKKILSINIDNHKIISYLNNLGLEFLNADAESLFFKVPPYRIDLTREIDLIEEIIRLHNFNTIEKRTKEPNIMNQDIFYIRRKIKNYFVSKGFREVVNISFTDPLFLKMMNICNEDYRQNVVKIVNPQGESFSILRSTLIPQLLKNVSKNLNFGNDNIKLFELNKVFTRNGETLSTEKWRLSGVCVGREEIVYWKEKREAVDYYDIKGLVEGIFKLCKIDLDFISLSTEPFYMQNNGFTLKTKNQILGSIGKIDKRILDNFDIKSDVYLFDLDIDKIFESINFLQSTYSPI